MKRRKSIMENTVEVIAKIIEDIADIPLDEIKEDSHMMDDLDLSSLEIMSIVGDVERKFSIKISEDELLSISTVGDLAKAVQNKISA